MKLAAVRRLYEEVRSDDPAVALTAPKDRTARAERVKYLPLERLRRLLNAAQGGTLKAARDRVILALMGRHGLRVSEVAGPDVGRVDL